MISNYEKYISDVSDDIQTCLEEMGCQPILFVGSGFTKRYINGPSWEELLLELSRQCPTIDKKFAYYKQKYNNFIEIGSIFSEKFNDWAWSISHDSVFPKQLFEPNYNSDIYFKYKICEFFENLTKLSTISLTDEIDFLKKIHPHSIITTNYDCLLEQFFPDYEPIIGQKILYSNHASIGEIFKIHGCSSSPESIIVTEKDYEGFTKKKKYLSAKLLTYFAEHPLIFIGYSAEDPNIKAILSDIDEILSENGDLIPNIYILEYDGSLNEMGSFRRERVINVSENKTIRIKSIVAKDFSWIYKAFGANPALDKVNPKLLRSLMTRTYQLVRSDIPHNPIQVDYSILSRVSSSNEELAKLYGISSSSDATAFSLAYPFTLKSLAQALGYKSWHYANKLLEQIKNWTGTDLKSFDNQYHCAIMNGQSVQSHRYSNLAKQLLEKVKAGEHISLVDLGL